MKARIKDRRERHERHEGWEAGGRFNERRDLRKHYRTGVHYQFLSADRTNNPLDVLCFEVCVYCLRIFTCRSTDYLAHQHKEPTATATCAAAVAFKNEYKDEEDHEDDSKGNELNKVYTKERRQLVLQKVETSLKRAEKKRKRPSAGVIHTCNFG